MTFMTIKSIKKIYIRIYIERRGIWLILLSFVNRLSSLGYFLAFKVSRRPRLRRGLSGKCPIQVPPQGGSCIGAKRRECFFVSSQPPDRGAGLTDFLILQGFTLKPRPPIRCCRQTAAVRRLLRVKVSVTDFRENFLLTKPWGSAGKFITTEKLSTAEKQNSGGRKVLGLPKPHPP